MIELKYEDNVAIITMNRGENRVNIELIEQFHHILDQILSNKQTVALITTGIGKFFSNGVDYNQEEKVIPTPFYLLMKRILLFPVPSVAAMNGHAFGAGLLLAMVHDYRVMREDKGWVCIPAINLGIILPLSIFEIFRTKVGNPKVIRDIVIHGKRYNATEAVSAGIVDYSVPPENLISKAKEVAKNIYLNLSKENPQFYSEFKNNLYHHCIQALNLNFNKL